MSAGVTYQATIRRLGDPEELGRTADSDIAAAMRAALSDQEGIRILLASAPSQRSTLTALAREPGIDWGRVTAFHLDEYVGLPSDSPQRFGNWLKAVILDLVPLQAV